MRLAQALARLRFADVEHDDVNKALRLMEVSKESLNDDNDEVREPDQMDMSKINRIIKDLASSLRRGGRRSNVLAEVLEGRGTWMSTTRKKVMNCR